MDKPKNQLDKKKVIDQIQDHLARELSDLLKQSERTGEMDPRAGEIKRLLLMYRFLPSRNYTEDGVIGPGGLVELELNGRCASYFIVPQGGGLVTEIEGHAVQVITPQSPLGEALLGRRVGDEIEVEVGGKVRCYKVVSYC